MYGFFAAVTAKVMSLGGMPCSLSMTRGRRRPIKLPIADSASRRARARLRLTTCIFPAEELAYPDHTLFVYEGQAAFIELPALRVIV